MILRWDKVCERTANQVILKSRCNVTSIPGLSKVGSVMRTQEWCSSNQPRKIPCSISFKGVER
jgi:hypothetical protein